MKVQNQLITGIKEPLSTADNPHRGKGGTIPELFLMTGNLGKNATWELDFLKRYQPNKPKMIMEFWSGWFDFWGKSHNTKSVTNYKSVYEDILKYPASVNIYLFRGGTNFGFLNGAENLKFDDLNTGEVEVFNFIIIKKIDGVSRFLKTLESLINMNPQPPKF